MTRSNLKTIARLTVVAVWIVLFGILLERDYFIKTLDTRERLVLRRDREESFSGVYFKEERIGYVRNRLVRDDAGDGYRLRQEAYLVLNILEQSHSIRMLIHADLGNDLLLRHFDFELSSPFYSMTAEGRVDGSTVNFILTTGKEKIKDSIRLAAPPFLSTNRRGYLLSADLKAGDKLRIPYFDPISLSGKDTVLEYKGYDKVLIKGRIQRLHHFSESFAGMRIESWLDDTGKVIKEESPAGFVFIAEPEFKATDIKTTGREILSSVSVRVEGAMPPDFASRTRLGYRLSYPAEAEVEIDLDRQELADGILTVTREEVPDDAAEPCPGPAAKLASTPYVQASHFQIAKLTEMLVDDKMSAMTKVRSLSAWVFDNLEKRPVLGIPDAVTTLRIRRGDCNEHAVLFAALARNVGIPTRIVAGVIFHEGAFYYHAWNEVCLDGSWLSLDTTRNEIPADVSHIKFVEGETREQIKIGGLLGKLKIEAVP
ncbi:MAG: transglutaminase-like domain-containing protein [Desulfurivibrionaceae bacterium]|nr:transglutaminase-like domain-containing protein [Desulfobulbales bacterium]MDT8335030.1 transglutaminase-like domain-containing protein [Desulfurivibrionaceae bacterium]